MRPGGILAAVATTAVAAMFAACGSAAPSVATGSAAVTATSTSSQPPATTDVATSEPGAAVIEGPGDLVLDPIAGTEALPGHRSTLTEAFEGTVAGQATTWSITTTLEVDDTGARALTVQRSGSAPDGYPEAGWSAITGGVVYVVADAQCTAGLAGAGAADAFLEPGRWLPGLVGASAAGSGEVDGIAVDNYTFDGRAIGIANAAGASGSTSLAASDGHVVRYSLTVTGGPDELGDGWSGTLTTTYALSQVGSTPAVVVPDGCPAGRIDFDVPVDATGVSSAPGEIAFTIAGSVPDAVAVVRGGSVLAHWTAGEQVVFEDEAHLMFTADGLTIDAFIFDVDAGAFVQITTARA